MWFTNGKWIAFGIVKETTPKGLLPTQSEAYFVRFWMMHHGGRSSKRSVFWGNVSTMGSLDKGTLSREEREKKTKIKTTRDLAVCYFILSSGLSNFRRYEASWVPFHMLYVYRFERQLRKIPGQIWQSEICWRQKGLTSKPDSCHWLGIDVVWYLNRWPKSSHTAETTQGLSFGSGWQHPQAL